MLERKVVRPLATAAAVVWTFLIAPVPSAAELACGSPPEGFESGLPAGWTSAGNSPVVWGTLATCGEADNFTGGPGDAACVSGSLADPGAIEAELRTSSFSLAGVTTARLEMRLNYQHFAAGDSLALEISDDGGWSWTLLRRDQRDLGAFAIADGDRVEVDLSDFAGRPQLVLRWRYSDPAANALDWYAQLDDVGLVCDPPPPCGAGVSERNRLADGGFEAGSPSAVWEEYSDNFPSPICTPTSCGVAGAQAGDAWAFFGGTTAAETASLAQSFTLFPGPATLRFAAWTAAASGNGQDRFRILVDDAEVALLSEGDARYTGDYRPLEIDLTAFADGDSHQLRLEAATAGTPGITNFFVDEVAINACPDLTVPPELWIADRIVVEGDADSELVLSVRLSHPWSQEVSVAYTTVDATAVAGTDYQHRAATLALPAGAVEAAITVPIHGDLDAEGDESFGVLLSDVSNATLVDAEATATLVDDDPRLAIAAATVTEGDHGYAPAAFTVSLTPPSSLPVTVDYSLAGATATAGEDFDSRPGTLVFAPGEASLTLEVPVFGDTSAEGDESFLVSLSDPANAKIDAGDAEGTIVDDDGAAFGVGDASVVEGNSGSTVVEVVVSVAGHRTESVTVELTTQHRTATAGVDYQPLTTELTFAPGQNVRTVPIEVLGDALDEADETFVVHLRKSTGAVVDKSIGRITILDDDGLTASAGGPYAGGEGQAVTFDATGSYHPDGTIVLYRWDLDGDGRFDDATGAIAEGTFADDGVYPIAVRVTDENGKSDDATALVVITNVAPTVDAGADRTITEVTAVAVAASFTDPGTLDTHTATIDWGDGTVEDAAVAGGTVAGSHVYPDPGTYLVAVCVSDDDGGRGCDGLALTAIYEPDLVVAAVDASAVATDRQTLEVTGTVGARIRNAGSAATASGFAVLFFADRNASGDYEPEPDLVLAEAVVAEPLAAKAELRVSAALSYTAAFGGSPIHVLVDSRHVVNERNEDNNLHHSGFACGLAGLGGPAKELGDFNAVLEWSWTGSPVEPTFNQVIMTPAVGDLDGDGIPDLIFNTREDLGGTSYRPGVLRAIRGDGGGSIFDLADPTLRTESPTHVAVGDLDGDGRPEIVAMLWWSGVVVLEHTGEVKWTAPGVDSGSYGGPTIANVDGEGLPEIVVGAWVLNADGTFHSSQRRNAGRGLASVADLDLDGDLEIVGGNQAWRHDGTVYFSNGGYDGFPAIGNFDADPYPEIVTVSYGTIYLLEHDGSEKWSVEHPGSGPGGPPVVADFDGDGEAEIGVAGKLAYAVIDGDGGILWTAPIMDSSSAISGSAVFDFEGDGAVEVLHNDHHTLRVFRGSDGAVLFETPNPTCTLTENPVVADVDGDGEAEIVAARNQMCGYGSQIGVFDQGIFVYGSPEGGWGAARGVWNEHGYHVTNVRDDLTIPVVEARGWLEPGLNVYRTQAAGPAQQADLTTSWLRIDASGCPSEVGIVARIGNGGAVDAPPVPVAFYLGPPDAGMLLGAVATDAELGPGELADLTLRTPAIDGAATICVAADDDGTRSGGVSECDEVNNLLCIDFVGFCTSSDLEITVTDGQTAAAPGTALTYTIRVANHGPADVEGATVNDVFPPSLVGVSWTCTPSGAATCTPGPVTGDLADQVAIAAGAAVTYTATGTLAPDAAGTVINTAWVTSPHVDPNPGNESASDETEIFDQADLAIAVTDAQTAAQPGSAITYTITVVNHGPNAAVAGLVADRFPAALLSPIWTCQGTGGAVCTPGPVAGPIHDPVALEAGSTLVYTVAATIDPGAAGTLSNRALVTATTFDPDPANNLAVDQTGLASQSDLVVTAVDVSGLVTHAQTLAASGTVAATAGNVGFAPAEGDFHVLFFADRNRTGAYEEGADLVLGEALVTGGLAVGAESTVAVSVDYTAAFAGEPVHAFADGGRVIDELDESNNVGSSGTRCRYAPAGPFDPVLEWSWTGSPVEPTFKQVIMTPAVADLDGDGIPDVIFNTREDLGGSSSRPGVLRAIRGDGAGPLFDLADPALRTESPTHVAVGDLDGDGQPEIVAMLSSSGIAVLEHTGEVKWTLSGVDSGPYGGPSIANVDGEGLPEIVVGAWVLNADGTFHSSQRRNAGRGLVSVADLDLDGTLEIVGGNQAWRHDGTVFFTTGGYDGFPAIGNFDTDLFPEIVVARSGRIYLYEHDGTEKWSLDHPGSGFGGPPTVADFDGDGAVEVGVAGSHRYAVVDTDGRLLWSSPTIDTSSNITSSAVFDFEGDGEAEVVYNDHYYLRVYRGRDGAVLAEIKNPSCTLTENPVIADVDADGNAEIIVARNQMCGVGQQIGIHDQGIFVYGDRADNWVATRRVWNQQGYHVTNVRDDLTIPEHEPENWLVEGLNNHRAQARAADEESPWVAPDLSVSALVVDPAGCPARAVLSVRIGNGGANLAPPVAVAFYAGDPLWGAPLLGLAATGAPLAPGQSETVELVVEGPPEGAMTVCVAVDGEAAVNECREGNNVHCLELAGLCDEPEPPAIAISDVVVVEGDAGTVEAELTVALSAPAPLTVEVDYATAEVPGVTATAGVDYQAIAGRLTIPAGEVAAPLQVPVMGDVVDEDDELFAVVLADPVNAVLEDALGYGTIADDDEALLAIDDAEIEEGDAGTAPARFTIRLATESDREVRVDYRTVPETAAADEDYLTSSDTLIFAPGDTAAPLAVPVVGDVVLERDEVFRVELANPINTAIADAVGVGTIRDDELCPGPNLLVNPGAEARPEEGELPGWIEVAGSDWQRRFADPDPAEGGAYFFAGTAEYAELVQDVDVGAYAARIAAGEQIFEFTGAVRTADEALPDVARIVAEYRDLHNHLVLEAFDSGEIVSPYEWHPVADLRVAPVGTGWIRLRLISTRFTGDTNDGYFDALSLRSQRAPTVVIDDVVVYEGHSGLTDSVFTVDLACAWEHPVSVDYSTADGTALAGEDYLVTAGTLAFPSGATTAAVTVPVLADADDEPDEVFLVELGPPLSAGEPVLLDPEGAGTIRNDDFCPRSHGYWKNHTELWPVDWLVLGGAEYDAAELLAFLRYSGRDAASKLALQLVATKLNLVRGSDPGILPVVEAADTFLEHYPPGSDPRGEARQEANAVKDDLDEYNNSCPSGD